MEIKAVVPNSKKPYDQLLTTKVHSFYWWQCGSHKAFSIVES